ncbi:hypothetical protein E0686_13075, partial [Deinococcus sp. S9]
GRALPAKLEVIHTLFLASGSAFSLPLQVQEMSKTLYLVRGFVLSWRCLPITSPGPKRGYLAAFGRAA